MPDRPHNARSPLPALTAAAAVGAIAFAWLSLRNGEAPIEPVPNLPSTPPAEPIRVATADPVADPPAMIKLRELRAMSETYRNTTFVIAIRDAGYVCHELLGVHGGVDSALAWTAACSDMLAYTVRVADSGSLAVEPLATYLDGLVPSTQTLPTPRQLQDQQRQFQQPQPLPLPEPLR
jgi:hypothetical protein